MAKVKLTLLCIAFLALLGCGSGGGSGDSGRAQEIKLAFKHDIRWTKRSAAENAELIPKLRADLAAMASFGVRTVKIALLPSETGLRSAVQR